MPARFARLHLPRFQYIDAIDTTRARRVDAKKEELFILSRHFDADEPTPHDIITAAHCIAHTAQAMMMHELFFFAYMPRISVSRPAHYIRAPGGAGVNADR